MNIFVIVVGYNAPLVFALFCSTKRYNKRYY